MEDSSKPWVQPDNLRWMMPILGLSFAILFDLGFFNIFGQNWFLIFSLSDHVLFSLTAVPIGVIIIILLSNFMIIPWFVKRYGSKILLKSDRFDGGEEYTRPRYWVLICLLVVAVLAVAVEVHFFEWKVVAAGITTTIIGAFLFYFREHLLELLVDPRVAALVSATLAFLSGTAYGVFIKSIDDFPYSLREKNGSTMEGVVLIAGERGILFLEKTSKATEFRRWDAVEWLRRRPR